MVIETKCSTWNSSFGISENSEHYIKSRTRSLETRHLKSKSRFIGNSSFRPPCTKLSKFTETIVASVDQRPSWWCWLHTRLRRDCSFIRCQIRCSQIPEKFDLAKSGKSYLLTYLCYVLSLGYFPCRRTWLKWLKTLCNHIPSKASKCRYKHLFCLNLLINSFLAFVHILQRRSFEIWRQKCCARGCLVELLFGNAAVCRREGMDIILTLNGTELLF